jgi:hypothetical protein
MTSASTSMIGICTTAKAMTRPDASQNSGSVSPRTKLSSPTNRVVDPPKPVPDFWVANTLW